MRVKGRKKKCSTRKYNLLELNYSRYNVKRQVETEQISFPFLHYFTMTYHSIHQKAEHTKGKAKIILNN